MNFKDGKWTKAIHISKESKHRAQKHIHVEKVQYIKPLQLFHLKKQRKGMFGERKTASKISK